MNPGLNRRGWFALLGRPFRRTLAPPGEEPPPARPRLRPVRPPGAATCPEPGHAVRAETGAPAPTVAVIQGRRCLALTSFCAVCVERCPVPGAITVMRGLPTVAPEVCTGCGLCQQVCPAPTNAVLMLPRRPAARPTTTTALV